MFVHFIYVWHLGVNTLRGGVWQALLPDGPSCWPIYSVSDPHADIYTMTSLHKTLFPLIFFGGV